VYAAKQKLLQPHILLLLGNNCGGLRNTKRLSEATPLSFSTATAADQ
jgi:hypothetical protein